VGSAVAAAVAAIKTGDTASGLIAAVKICGDALAQNFPPTGGKSGTGGTAEI